VCEYVFVLIFLDWHLLKLHRKRLCDSQPEDVNYQTLPEERPGGFNWGEGRRLADDEDVPDNDL